MIIYKVTNLINGKCYIGQTAHTIHKRWKEHCNPNSKCVVLHRAIDKYGANNFSIEQIDSAENRNELNEKERYWILHYNTLYPNGYNLTNGGNAYEFTKEVKHKMSEHARRRKVICVDTLEIFDSVKSAAKSVHRHAASLIEALQGQQSTCGGKHWMYLTDYEKHGIIIRNKIPTPTKIIRCVETNEIFTSAREAGVRYNISHTAINNVLRGRSQTAAKLHWEYYEEVRN